MNIYRHNSIWSIECCLTPFLSADFCVYYSVWPQVHVLSLKLAPLPSQSLTLPPYKRLHPAGVFLKWNSRERNKMFAWRQPGFDISSKETTVVGEEVFPQRKGQKQWPCTSKAESTAWLVAQGFIYGQNSIDSFSCFQHNNALSYLWSTRHDDAVFAFCRL